VKISMRRNVLEYGALTSLAAQDEGRDIEEVMAEAEQRLYSIRRGNISQVASVRDVTGPGSTALSAAWPESRSTS